MIQESKRIDIKMIEEACTAGHVELYDMAEYLGIDHTNLKRWLDRYEMGILEFNVDSNCQNGIL